MDLGTACFLIGGVCGLRSMTAPAAVALAPRFGWLHFASTKLAFIENPVTPIVFSLLAIGELVADKLPQAPARTAAPGLIARAVFGGACGGAMAVSGNASVLPNVALGVLGAMAGTFGGYWARRSITSGGKVPDLPVALVEDAIAIGGAFLVLSQYAVQKAIAIQT